jgi:WXG100 family type VII secretion target
MPGPHVRTETSAMSTAAADASGVAELLASQLNSLMGRLEPLYTTWQGDGGGKFQIVKEAVNLKLLQLKDALNDLAVAVGESGVTYGETDIRSAEEVGRVQSLVDGVITNALTPGRSSV